MPRKKWLNQFSFGKKNFGSLAKLAKRDISPVLAQITTRLTTQVWVQLTFHEPLFKASVD